MEKRSIISLVLVVFFFCSCGQRAEHRVIMCVPVYGQSYALGEEAERMTDFDSLASYADGRILTQNLDHSYGYFDNDDLKQLAKKLLHYQKRAYELSVYSMAMQLADQIENDTLICIFPGGQGATAIANLGKGTAPYHKFMDDIETAYKESVNRGWDFWIPAICWMQGESDICDYPNTDYQQLLVQIWEDMNYDIGKIIQREDTIPFICYQPNLLTRAEHFKAGDYDCRETYVPQTFVNLLRDDRRFWASGPTYPYPCVNERVHIDANGQRQIGKLAANSVLGILKRKTRFRGLIPVEISAKELDVKIKLNVPDPPLVFDTLNVRKADHYGFSVVTHDNRNIISSVAIDSNIVIIRCSEYPSDCKIRYAVNGDYMKSGNQHGPRGNLRDSKGHWCYQFDIGY